MKSFALILMIVVAASTQSEAFSLPIVRGFVAGAWKPAHATFYTDINRVGACGWQNTHYGQYTAALSASLFVLGYGCGQCYQIKCFNSPFCTRNFVTITATNLCPPGGLGWCNFPRQHFDLSQTAFTTIAQYRAGIVPVQYRRVPCQRSGGIQLKLTGNAWWLLVFISNVGGPGDIKAMAVKGTRTGWINMSRNWGAAFQVFSRLQGQSLSFSITSYTSGKTVVAINAIPSTWQFGLTYTANVQLS